MTEKTLPAQPRLPHLDLLRGLAVLYIVAVRHLGDYAGGFYHNKLDSLMTYSFLGLLMFISGYLLSRNSPIDNRADLLKFISKRLLRIYPLYVLALVLFMLCSLMSFYSLWLHVSLLNVLLDKSVMTLWFVSVICLFYIFYPVIIYRYSLSKTAVIFVLFFTFFILVHRIFGLLDKRLFIYIPLFIFGIVSFKHGLIERYLDKKIAVVGSIICCTLLYLYYDSLRFNRMFFILFLMSGIPSLLLMGKLLSNIINKSIYSKTAYASFCMYLFHRVIFHLMTKTYSPSSDFHTVIYLTLVGVPIIFAISFYLQKYYDRLISFLKKNWEPYCKLEHLKSKTALFCRL